MDLRDVAVPELHCSVSFTRHLLAVAYLTSSHSLDSSDQTILASPYAFVANQPNYQCSVEIYATQLAKFPAAQGYTIIFANILNSSDVSSHTSHLVGHPHSSFTRPTGLCHQSAIRDQG